MQSDKDRIEYIEGILEQIVAEFYFGDFEDEVLLDVMINGADYTVPLNPDLSRALCEGYKALYNDPTDFRVDPNEEDTE